MKKNILNHMSSKIFMCKILVNFLSIGFNIISFGHLIDGKKINFWLYTPIYGLASSQCHIMRLPMFFSLSTKANQNTSDLIPLIRFMVIYWP